MPLILLGEQRRARAAGRTAAVAVAGGTGAAFGTAMVLLRAGVAFSQMRICQPYGDDQRKGLD
ncbi:hypothetical protein, partial [Achromobacter xylosoxidans]|uniref:hypothetical protein n=1 Tax=Alcaligenes xylosoxydans xylosoxydans TaxID=85698 RepID=UPI0022B8A03E